MSDTIIAFPGSTKLDVSVERVLEAAERAKLTDIIILGWDADKQEYFAASMADGGTVLWLMERLKIRLLT